MSEIEVERITVRIGETLLTITPGEARELAKKLCELLGDQRPLVSPAPIVIQPAAPPITRPYWVDWQPHTTCQW